MPDLGAERVDKVKKLEDYVINIPDFPKPGIIFRDITSILRDPEGLKLSVHELMHCLEGTEIDLLTIKARDLFLSVRKQSCQERL